MFFTLWQESSFLFRNPLRTSKVLRQRSCALNDLKDPAWLTGHLNLLQPFMLVFPSLHPPGSATCFYLLCSFTPPSSAPFYLPLWVAIQESAWGELTIGYWKIPWMEKPSRLQSMGLQSRTRLNNFTHCPYGAIPPVFRKLIPHYLAIKKNEIRPSAATYYDTK